MPDWAIYDAWRGTYRELMLQVTLDSIEPPINLSSLQLKELTRQAVRALKLSGESAEALRAQAPIASPWSAGSPPGRSPVQVVLAMIPPGECLAPPPRIATRRRSKKARFRRSQRRALSDLSEE